MHYAAGVKKLAKNKQSELKKVCINWGNNYYPFIFDCIV
jgi:hypothetical protein